MRRMRRGGHGGLEFGGSGEDSFVAVVVTKLTGALLFILLLTMVIMALVPKAIDQPRHDSAADVTRLEITTPELLPEALAGRPYTVAMAATGAHGPLRWRLDGPLPAGLTFDSSVGRLHGLPRVGTPQPADLTLHVTDGQERAARPVRLLVYQSDRPLTTPSRWKPSLPPVPWRAWMEQGFGFILLLLVHLVGMNTVSQLESWSMRSAATAVGAPSGIRFGWYRWTVRLVTLGATTGLAFWLWKSRS